ncbi:MAG: UDP-3-O-acyl-N-acetylglucosamine deacetylase [Alphaproteobacteria bacterium]
MMQTTVKHSVSVRGIGLHTGKPITMTFQPAEAESGIVFVRSDLPTAQGEIPALFDYVIDTQLCTVIGNEFGARVGTIEHVMSALRAMGVDNLRIEIDGPEVPIMDGSAMPFVEMIESAGVESLSMPRKMIKVLREVRFEEGGRSVSLKPADHAVFAGEIEFPHPAIGRQTFSTALLNGNFVHDIATARTFGFMKDVEMMRANGLALGGSLENAIVLNDTSVLNAEGLRYADEFIRHKLLDAIGDLYLAGGQILGAYDSYKAGHYTNNMLLRALFADERNYMIVSAVPQLSAVSSSGVSLSAQ